MFQGKREGIEWSIPWPDLRVFGSRTILILKSPKYFLFLSLKRWTKKKTSLFLVHSFIRRDTLNQTNTEERSL